jgi:hypothetical protein
LSDDYFIAAGAGSAGLDRGVGGTAAENGGSAGSGLAGTAATGGSNAVSAGSDSGGTGAEGSHTAGSGTGGSEASGEAGGTSSSGNTGEAGADAEAGAGTGGEGALCVPETERCDGVSNDCDEEIDEDSVCPDSCSARQYDGHLYLLCVADSETDAIECDDAAGRCADFGDELGLELPLGLVWVESSAENAFLKDWITAAVPSEAAVWTGANDQTDENTWVWGRREEAEQFFTGDSDGGGTPYEDRFNDFAPGRPNSSNGDDEDCGAFDPEVSWQWNDRTCTNAELAFVCEEHPPERSR